jgi:hypothetical protein
MQLHRLVRGAINAVNKDQQIGWLASTRHTTNTTTGVSTPEYAALQNPWAQIQPVRTDQLTHLEQLNIQGVLRSVYLKGAVASAVREDGTGGDLLQFPELLGGTMRTWLVMLVDEQWPDWCHVIVRLQNDMNNA